METRVAREGAGAIEAEHPGYLVARDIYYVGSIKGVGRIVTTIEAHCCRLSNTALYRTTGLTLKSGGFFQDNSYL